MMKRIKAFSLLEVTVVLLLSGLVTSLGYITLEYFSKSLFAVRTKTDRIQEISLLNKVIQEKVAFAESITYSGDLKMVNDHEISIFKLSNDKVIFRRNGQEMKQFDVEADLEVNKVENTDLVNHIVIYIEEENTKFKFELSKNYDASTLMQFRDE